jgi:hypothetical protein
MGTATRTAGAIMSYVQPKGLPEGIKIWFPAPLYDDELSLDRCRASCKTGRQCGALWFATWVSTCGDAFNFCAQHHPDRVEVRRVRDANQLERQRRDNEFNRHMSRLRRDIAHAMVYAARRLGELLNPAVRDLVERYRELELVKKFGDDCVFIAEGHEQ